MKYQKQSLFIVAVIAVAVLFWGYDAWQQGRVRSGDWPALEGGLYTDTIVRDGVNYLVAGDQIYDSGVEKDGIPAINEPKYISVVEADNVIADDIYGIDVEVDGEHRYYPYQIMNWHEVVNDSFNGKELAITYCTLCGTPVVYERQVNGQTVQFGVSGKVYNNNTLLYDTLTDSLWLQATGQAIVGSSVGQTLSIYPSSQVMRWKDWKAAFSDGEVLSTDTGFTRDYTRHPYGLYETSNAIYFPINHTSTAFGNKWIVSLVEAGGESAAFAWKVLFGIGIEEAEVGGAPLIGVYDFDLDIGRVFSRVVDDQTLSFTFEADDTTMRDTTTNSVWNAQGVAISGSLKGSRLSEMNSRTSYWVCAHTLNPDIRSIGAESTGATQAEDETTITVDGTNQDAGE